MALNESQVEKFYKNLNREQRHFLEKEIVKSKKSLWLEALSQKKGIPINTDMSLEETSAVLEDWILEEVFDGGYGNRPYNCECGQPLRHLFVVYHTKEKKRYKLGSTCIESYTMLDPQLVNDIRRGFHKINLERDEILMKHHQDCFFDIHSFNCIHDDPRAEQLIKQSLIGLPLTDKQIKKLQKINYENEIRTGRAHRVSSPRESILLKERANRVTRSMEYQERSTSFKNQEETITYDELMDRHLLLLQIVRRREEELSKNGRADLDVLREFARALRDGNKTDIAYDIFILRLRNICRQLKIDLEVHKL